MGRLLNWVAAIGAVVLFAVTSAVPESPAYAGDFMSTHSEYHRSCRVDLGNAISIEAITLQKAVQALPCRDVCPFDNISQYFYLHKIIGDALRKACWPAVLPPTSLVPTSGGGSAGRHGGFNIVYIYQDGSGNIIAVYQHGSGELAILLQDGSGNTIVVTQNGYNDVAGILQTGNNNTLGLTQNGNNQTFIGVQNGGDTLNYTQNANGQTNVVVQ